MPDTTKKKRKSPPSLVARTVDFVHSKGIPLPSQPLIEFDWEDITKVNDRKLGSLLQAAKVWEEYVKTEATLADIERSSLEYKLETQSAEVLLTISSTKYSSVQERKSVKDADQSVKKIKQLLLIAEAKYKLLDVMARGYEDKSFVISREITRRRSLREG